MEFISFEYLCVGKRQWAVVVGQVVACRGPQFKSSHQQFSEHFSNSVYQKRRK